MEAKFPHLLLCIFLLFLLTPLLPIANSSNTKQNKSSPNDFINHFNGSKKGDKVKGLQEIKNYLEKYGYLSYQLFKNADDDYFDETLESAVKTYQLNYHLNVTGALDPDTLSLMAMPRCGVPDIINGTNLMQVSYYQLGHSKWPRFNLTWALNPGTRPDAINPIVQAFSKWASVSRFKFSNTGDFTSADLKIGFFRGNHGDNQPFDGPGKILAHASFPPDGRLHFDADETWAVGAVPGAVDIGTVGLHEMGHLLGLGHSSVQAAIMYPFLPSGSTKDLNKDDIDGIKALYP